MRSTVASRNSVFSWSWKMPRTDWAMSEGFRPAVATWYSRGWNTWWLRRSTIVTSTGWRTRRVAAPMPPNPAPTITTRGRSFSGTPAIVGTRGLLDVPVGDVVPHETGEGAQR